MFLPLISILQNRKWPSAGLWGGIGLWQSILQNMAPVFLNWNIHFKNVFYPFLNLVLQASLIQWMRVSLFSTNLWVFLFFCKWKLLTLYSGIHSSLWFLFHNLLSSCKPKAREEAAKNCLLCRTMRSNQSLKPLSSSSLVQQRCPLALKWSVTAWFACMWHKLERHLRVWGAEINPLAHWLILYTSNLHFNIYF